MGSSNEIWKDIEGYEGLYQVSNLGRVKSKKYNKEKMLKPYTNSGGYSVVGLRKDGKTKFFRVHRLVAKAFIPNPDPENKTQVNHKNEFDKKNNCVENLEWVTPSENTNYATGNKRRRVKQGKKVYQYTLDRRLVKIWNSTRECEEGGFSKSAISEACRTGKHYYGYRWSYKPL